MITSRQGWVCSIIKLIICLCFQIQSDTSPCMTTNTFGISQDTQKGKMWLGDSTGEIEIMIVMSLSYITLNSFWFLLCRTVCGNFGLVHNHWGGCCFIHFFCVSLIDVVFCVAELLLFQCLQWMILLFLDLLIKLFDFGISALQIAR